MLWRHLCLVRATLAAGLTSGLILASVHQAAAQAPRAADPEASAPPAGVATETVDLLGGMKQGELNVVARGQGQDKVHLTIKSTSAKRLNVVLPPGLVASSAAAQGRGGGLQSMGLGSISNRSGSFGQFRPEGAVGLRSVAVEASRLPGLTVPAGETVEVTVPAVCLNYGSPRPPLATPSPSRTWPITARIPGSASRFAAWPCWGPVSPLPRAVMWRVCNDLPFETMIAEAGKVMNEHEVALAAQFVAAVDSSTGSELVDPATLAEGRIFVQISGEATLARDTQRLGEQLENHRLLGLPVRVVKDAEPPATTGPALFVRIQVTDSQIGETRGRLAVSTCSTSGLWSPLGKATFQESSSLAVLDGDALARAVDRSLASAFVSVKPARRAVGSTTLKVENHLPFTLSGIVVKAGGSAGAPSVPMDAIGVGPARSALLPIQAATATIERVELNGL